MIKTDEIIMLLRDDRVIELFNLPDGMPNWVELIDIENDEYKFCSITGQRYEISTEEISGPKILGILPTSNIIYKFNPVGTAKAENALAFVDRADKVENDKVTTIEELKQIIKSAQK
jgi:type IV secretory pathway VirB4 component